MITNEDCPIIVYHSAAGSIILAQEVIGDWVAGIKLTNTGTTSAGEYSDRFRNSRLTAYTPDAVEISLYIANLKEAWA